MKNGFDELISILDMAEGRILEFKDMSTETSKQKSREKRKTNKQTKRNRIFKHYETTTKSIIYIQWDIRRGRK